VRAFLIAGLLLILCSSVFAEAVPWVDSWNNLAYYNTNTERNNFNSFLLRSESKFGIRMSEGMPIEPYAAYYLSYSQDKDYWNNLIAFGAGLRGWPLKGYTGSAWYNEWIKDIKLFVEMLGSSYLQDADTAKTVGVKNSDVRLGTDLWYEWNLAEIDPKVPWGEVWGNLSFRDTNFYQQKFSTYLLYLQPKWGVHLTGGLRPYLCSYIMYSGRQEAWFNMAAYGVGARVEPFREDKNVSDFMRKFKMFIEVLGITWLKEKDSRPSADMRFGIDLTIGR